ncbi:MAG: flagellar biosynthetic protein FliO [Planctomycetota bacterium]|nr:flagellar biosynthetic protein FliO [Planctomycetota bacterium]
MRPSTLKKTMMARIGSIHAKTARELPSVLLLAICLTITSVSTRVKADSLQTDASKGALSTSPTSPQKDIYSEQLIKRDSNVAPAPLPKDSTPLDTLPPAVKFDAARVILALGGVIGLILLTRLFAKRWIPGATLHRATDSMKIISRVAIAPRQHLLLVQVGKRLVVVGDTGMHLNPLCEITDANEVEQMLDKVREESIAAASKFDVLFGRARKGFVSSALSQSVDNISDAEGIDAAGATGFVPQSTPRRLNPVSESTFDPTHEINDPSVVTTRNELSDLSEKVKDLARQLGGA